MKRLMLLMLLLLLTSTACARPLEELSVPPASESQAEATAEATLPQMAEDPAPLPDEARARHEVEVSLDDEAHKLAVSHRLTYPNTTGKPLEELVFHLTPQAFEADGGKIVLSEVTVDNQAASLEPVEGTVYRLPLAQTLAPGDEVTVQLAYEVLIPNIQNRFGYQEEVYNLGNFLITPAVYGEEGWCKRPYVDLGDAFYTDLADYAVTIQAPADYVIAATGRKDADGCYRAEAVRDFAFCASKSFLTRQTEVNGVTLTMYLQPELSKTADSLFAAAEDSFRLYCEAFSPYPYEQLSLVVNGLTGGVSGMEYPQLVMLSPEVPLEYYLESGYAEDSEEYVMARHQQQRTVCHEIAHQWFYGLIGNDQINEPWLDEGLCRFSELLYEETIDGLPQDTGYLVLDTILAYLPQNGEYDDDIHLDWSLYQWMEDDPMWYGSIYDYGAAMLFQMRERLGDEAFGEALKEYVRTFSYRMVSTEEFVRFWSQKGDFEELFAGYLGN